MPEEHDCSNCDHTDACPATTVIPWIDEHLEELEGAKERQKRALVSACRVFFELFPDMEKDRDKVVDFLMSGFALGYYEGRKYAPVPMVF